MNDESNTKTGLKNGCIITFAKESRHG